MRTLSYNLIMFQRNLKLLCTIRLHSLFLIDTGCFPGDSFVRLVDGNTKLMSDLELGDQVLAYDVITNRFVYSPVILFSHRVPDVTTHFRSLQTANNRHLILTDNHLIHVITGVGDDNLECGNHSTKSNVKVIFASDLQNGDNLITIPYGNAHHSAVIHLESTQRKGIYAPVTHIGTIVVNDVVVSCYCEITNHDHVHSVFALFRFIYDALSYFTQNTVIGTINDITTESDDKESFVYLRNANVTSVTSPVLVHSQTTFDVCYWIVTRICRPASFVHLYSLLLA